jgi:hypothetical protein
MVQLSRELLSRCSQDLRLYAVRRRRSCCSTEKEKAAEELDQEFSLIVLAITIIAWRRISRKRKFRLAAAHPSN